MAELSVADADKRTGRLQAQIDSDLRFVLHVKQQAAKQKDVIKLSCVNDRLVQLKARLNLGDETLGRLRDALLLNDAERHALLALYEEHAVNVRKLREEAIACVGEPELYKQESGGTETEHPPLPDDPTQDDPFQPDIEPPGYASPFR